MRKAWDHPEHALLLPPAQIRLKADEVVGTPPDVLYPQLRDRPRSASSPRVGESHGLEGAKAQRIVTAARDLLDGLAGHEQLSSLEVPGHDALCRHELLAERVVLPPVQRAVQIVPAFGLLVARLGKDDIGVKRLTVHNRCCRIEEGEGASAQPPRKVVEKRP